MPVKMAPEIQKAYKYGRTEKKKISVGRQRLLHMQKTCTEARRQEIPPEGRKPSRDHLRVHKQPRESAGSSAIIIVLPAKLHSAYRWNKYYLELALWCADSGLYSLPDPVDQEKAFPRSLVRSSLSLILAENGDTVAQ